MKDKFDIWKDNTWYFKQPVLFPLILKNFENGIYLEKRNDIGICILNVYILKARLDFLKNTLKPQSKKAEDFQLLNFSPHRPKKKEPFNESEKLTNFCDIVHPNICLGFSSLETKSIWTESM